MIKICSSQRLLLGVSVLSVFCYSVAHDAYGQGTHAAPVVKPNGKHLASRAVQDQNIGKQKAEQLLVTSSRVERMVQKTPTSVTLLSGKTLDQSNIVSLSGLNGSVPGLNVSQTAGYQTNITIRGVGMQTPENTLNTSTGVAFYVDGVYIANSISLDQTLFDVDNVNVLRGPQGTVYGQSAPGGAIILNTNQPKFDRISGHVEATGGNYNLSRGRVELNVPITRTLAIRGSFQKFDHDGFAHTSSPYIGHYQLDDQHDISGKLAIKWQPIDNFSATLTGQWYGAYPDGPEQKNINDPISNPRIVSQDYPTKYNLHTSFYHLNLEWDLPWATLTSVTATQHVNSIYQYDSGRLNFADLGKYDYDAKNNNSLNNYSETIALRSRAGRRLDWTVGLYVMGQRGHQLVTEYEGTTAIDPVISVPANVVSNPQSNLAYGDQETANRFAIQPYFQVGYRITKKLHINGGVRYNYDRYNASNIYFSAYGGSQSNHTYSTSIPTWKAELDYDVDPDKMVYFSIATGYKPGGVNGNDNAKIIKYNFQAEQNMNFEIGAKNWFLNRTFMFNASAFFSDYKNMQYIANDPYPYAYGVANLPKAHMYGIEGEAAYLMFHGRLRLEGNLTLEDGQIVGHPSAIDAAALSQVYATAPACGYGGSYYNPACWSAAAAAATNLHGNKPPGLVSVQGSLSASYLWNVPYGKLLTKVQYIYRGPYEARIFNNPAYDHVPSYNLFNFYMDYKPNRLPMDFSLACSNLTNMAGVNSRYTDPYGTNQTSIQYIAPRQIMGTVSYDF
ncbi:TonB-dependent receptor [Komagataeibacter rhaeticus]|uniref:TonB-dependent receptor n=1 Tax=Komagataeibacter rhaeticus TaxID=215221 RepID=UPI0039E794B9